ncbi:hypothetical protein [Kribbella catacumbae]|uniref:hypothetical protein n=1 Tax=Kribbella catacumbae TaxID=460086 RepID=UPI00037384F9|nr:hypothetical protein [Kribbella catacumbae]
MESDAREQLQIVERAEAAPYIHYPRTPWWYPPVVGLWVAAMITAFLWWRANTALFAASVAILLVLEGAFLAWMQRRHGAMPMPGRGTPPKEIGAVWRRYFMSLPVVIAVVGLAWWLIGVHAAALTAFVVVTAGLAYYERRYAAAAAKVRERLG